MSKQPITRDELATKLAASPILYSLSPEEIAVVRDAARERHVPAGQAIVRQGDNERRFYIIVSGTAVVEGVTLGPGDHFGEIAMLDGKPRTATVTAVTDVHLVSFADFSLRALIREHPDIALGIMQGLATLARR